MGFLAGYSGAPWVPAALRCGTGHASTAGGTLQALTARGLSPPVQRHRPFLVLRCQPDRLVMCADIVTSQLARSTSLVIYITDTSREALTGTTLDSSLVSMSVGRRTMDQTDESPSAVLLRLLNGFRVSQAIHAAATLGLADLLKDGARGSDDLAAATGTHPQALYRLLRALASVGVFREEPDLRFALTPSVNACA